METPHLPIYSNHFEILNSFLSSAFNYTENFNFIYQNINEKNGRSLVGQVHGLVETYSEKLNLSGGRVVEDPLLNCYIRTYSDNAYTFSFTYNDHLTHILFKNIKGKIYDVFVNVE